MPQLTGELTLPKHSSGVAKWFRQLAAIAICLAAMITVSHAQSSSASNQVQVDLTRIGDASHFEFSGISNWKYDFKKSPGSNSKVTLRIPSLDEKAIAKLKSHKDNLIQAIEINEKGLDRHVEITFTITESTDFFDYISDEPTRLIVDFFPKEPSDEQMRATADSAKKSEKKTAKSGAQKDQKKAAALKAEAAESLSEELSTRLPAKGDQRAPAGTDFVVVAKGQLPPGETLAETISAKPDFNHGIFDGGDPEFRRFTIKDYEVKQSAIRASRANFYLPFPMLELGSPHLKVLLENPPIYEIVPSETKENKEARLLLTLFSKKRRAVFLKAGDEFLKKYPDSPYDEIVRYMMADTHFNLWKTQGTPVDFELAMGQYRYLTEKYPDSPVTPRTLLLMGYAYVDRGDSIAALKDFQRFTRMKPNSKHLDQVNIAIAEALLKINRFDDAYQMLDQVERSGKTLSVREDAAFRKGDVFFKKKDGPEALRQYRVAVEKYPQSANRFPNTWYNIAELEFNQRNYRKALESYRMFLTKFPDHEHGGYAMTRMGELLGILGAPEKRAQGAFFESYFRYRATPGAGVARIRSLASRMKEMKEKELVSSIQEIEEITSKYSGLQAKPKKDERAPAQAVDAADEKSNSEQSKEKTKEAENNTENDAEATAYLRLNEEIKKQPELPGIEEFSSLLIADGLTDRKEYDKAVDKLVSFYQANPRSPNNEKFRVRIIRNLTDSIRSSVEKGDFIDALRRYSKNSGGWLKNNPRTDLRFYVGRSYELAGVLSEAESVYRQTLKSLADSSRTDEANEDVFETPPKNDSVHLRLAVVAAKQDKFMEAESHLKNITRPSDLTEPEQIERVQISADVAEARGQSDIARKYLAELLNTWKGDPELTSPVHLRVADLFVKSKKFEEADQHLSAILKMKEEWGRVSSDIHARALEMRADLFLKRGKRSDAVATYQKILELYENERPLDSIRYRLGQVLFEDGNLKEAETVWSQLKADKDNVWQRLASEQMEGAKWKDEYKKYLNRIPAAAGIRENEESVKR